MRIIAALAITAAAATFTGCTTDVDPSSQDDGCHRHALAYASNNDPSFEWNGEGMDLYNSEYDACMAITS